MPLLSCQELDVVFSLGPQFNWLGAHGSGGQGSVSGKQWRQCSSEGNSPLPARGKRLLPPSILGALSIDGASHLGQNSVWEAAPRFDVLPLCPHSILCLVLTHHSTFSVVLSDEEPFEPGAVFYSLLRPKASHSAWHIVAT